MTTNRPIHLTVVLAAAGCLCALATAVPAQVCPALVASMSLEGPGFPQMAVSEDYAYLGQWGLGLTIVDVASPAVPVALWSGSGLCEPPGVPGQRYDLEASGGVVYDIHESSGVFGLFVCVIDARSPASPVVLPADFSLGNFPAASLALSASYLYVASYPYRLNPPYTTKYVGLKIFDVLEPSSPVEVGSFHYLPDPWVPGDFAVDVVVSGSYAYLVAGPRLTVIDVMVPSSPVEVGFLEMPESAERVAVSGSHAYVVTRTGEWPEAQSTLRVIDVSSPSSPVEVGSVAMQGNFTAFAVDSKHAYVSLFEELRVINVQAPSSPVEVGSVALADQLFLDVAASGRYAYVVGEDRSEPDPATCGRLYVFDTWACRQPAENPMLHPAVD